MVQTLDSTPCRSGVALRVMPDTGVRLSGVCLMARRPKMQNVMEHTEREASERVHLATVRLAPQNCVALDELLRAQLHKTFPCTNSGGDQQEPHGLGYCTGVTNSHRHSARGAARDSAWYSCNARRGTPLHKFGSISVSPNQGNPLHTYVGSRPATVVSQQRAVVRSGIQQCPSSEPTNNHANLMGEDTQQPHCP